MARSFHINLDADPSRSLLINGFVDDATADSPVFARSDAFTAHVSFFRSVGGRLINVAAPDTLKMGAGEIDAAPTGGTFIINDTAGSQSTAAIAYNASAATVQTAIRAALTTNFSNATVTGDNGGPYLIDRVTTGALANITGTATALTPSGSEVSIVNTEDGNGSLSEKWQLRLTRALPMLRVTGWVALPSAAVACDIIQAGVAATANKVYEVSWNQDAFGGAVILSVLAGGTTATVGPIAYNATAEEVKAAFVAHSGIADADIDVQQTDVCTYAVTFQGALANSNTPTISDSSDTLQVPLGYSGDMTVSTAGADALLGSEDEVDVTFEVEIRETAGLPRTVCRIIDAKFLKDLIVNNPGQVTGDEQYVTQDELNGARTRAGEDDAEVLGLTPDFIGQLAVSEDTRRLFQSDGTTAADWNSDFTFNTVTASNYTVTGGFRPALATKTTTYAATANDHTILCDATAGAFDIDLPAAATCSGQIYVIKKIDSGANVVSIDPNGTEEIDNEGAGAAVQLTTENYAATIQSTGTKWVVLNVYSP